jgi:hypothetical protein
MEENRDSEHLCLACGVNEATHEYCDACAETVPGDYIVYGARDWVVHVTEAQQEFSYVEDNVERMLRSGCDMVCVWTGEKAAQGFERDDRGAREMGPSLEETFVCWTDQAPTLVVDLTMALSQAWSEGVDEVVFLTPAGKARREGDTEAADRKLFEIVTPGPRTRRSPLAERIAPGAR